MVQRYGGLIGIKAEKLDEYLSLHRQVWPAVQERMRASHIRNYTIFWGFGYLFNYYEYIGQHHEEDMSHIAEDPVTQQ